MSTRVKVPVVTRTPSKAQRMLAALNDGSIQFDSKMLAKFYTYAVEVYSREGDESYLQFFAQLEQIPVSIEEFLDSEDFFGSTDLKLWTEVRRAIIDINKDWYKGWDNAKNVAILSGGTSTGKSECAKVTIAYHLHILGCMNKPQRFWGLPEATSIVFTIQAAKPKVTKNVLYTPLRAYIEQMPWFTRFMRPDKYLESEMYFDSHNIRVVQGGSDTDAILGDAIIGGCFPRDQLLLTSSGTLSSMEDLLGEDIQVKTTSFETNYIVNSQHTKVVETGRKPFVELLFSNGERIVCTPDQKFRGAYNEWVAARWAEGRHFRFTAMQDMRSAGQLLDTTSCGSPQDTEGQGIGEGVTEGLLYKFYGHNVTSSLVKCVSVKYVSVDLRQCFDVENTGLTHSFFAATQGGFLEAKNCVDEINFMNIVERSKRAALGTGRSGTYDQAQVLFDTLTRRKQGRFRRPGPNVGVLIASSSTRYRGDFTDKLIAHVVKEELQQTHYIYNKAQYEVWPQERYCGRKFRLQVSTDNAMDIRILQPDDVVPQHTKVLEVPIEYEDDFKRDPAGSLRDIVGMSANSISPFFRQQHKIIEAIERGREAGIESFLHNDNVVLAYEGLPMVVQGHYCQNPSKPRYVHIDLAITQDRAGIVMLRYDGMGERARAGGVTELLPMVTVEMAVSVEPDHSNEIDLAELRNWVRLLKTRYGYPIRGVSYDGFNSIESIQAWKKAGMRAGIVSVDRTSVPYKSLRDAFNDGRIAMYEQQVLSDELFGLEYDEKRDKIDHPVSGTGKDVADALCGAYYTLLTRSDTWVDTGSEEYSGRAEFAGREDPGPRM